MRQFTVLFLLMAPALTQAARVDREGITWDGVPAVETEFAARLDRYAQGREVRLLDWTADGGLLVASRLGEAEQLYRVASPLANLEQQSFFGGALRAAVAPHFTSQNIALIKAGDAGPALFLLPLAEREPRQLVAANAMPDSPVWAHDGRRLAFSGRQRNGIKADLYVLDTTAGALPQLVGSANGDWQAQDWSLDDRYLLAISRAADGSSELQLVDLVAGGTRVIEAPAEGAAVNRKRRGNGNAARKPQRRILQARFAPGARTVLYLTDEGSEFLRIRSIDLDGSEVRDVTPAVQHDVTRFDVSGDGRLLAYVYQESGIDRLVLIDQRAGLEKTAGTLPVGVISALRFDRAGQKLAVNVESATAPPDVFVLEVASLAATRWTQSELGPITVDRLIAPQPFRFATWDRRNGQPRQLSALIYKPKTAGPHPVLIWLPGGDGQPRQRFDPLLQQLVGELGFAVIVPALRGSGGQGRSFAALDDGGLRDDAARDVGSLLVWIGLQGDLDRNRIAVLGRGSSAYTALTSLAQYGDRVQRAVIIDGQPNNAQLLAIKRPVLVLRGFESPTSLQSNAEQLLWRLRANGADVWWVSNATPAAEGQGLPMQSPATRSVAQFLNVLR